MPDTEPGSFNRRVEDTAFAGGVNARLSHIEASVNRIDTRTEKMWGTQERFLGVLALGTVVLPIVMSVVLKVYFP